MVSRAENILREYKEMGVSEERILIRIPGTWEGIQAAKHLEAKGVQTHVILIYRSASQASAPFIMHMHCPPSCAISVSFSCTG